jgi:hypothetical protein
MKTTLCLTTCLTTLAASALMFSSAALAADAPQPVAVTAAFNAAEQAPRMFTVALPEVLKGVKRVAVPLFTIDFTTADSESAETSGFAAAGRARAASFYKLKGVGQAEFQAITEAAYARFLADLQAAGFETVAADRWQASGSYRKMAATGKPAPALRDDGMTLAPAGMAIYGFSQAGMGGSSKSQLFGALASMGTAFSSASSAMSAAIDGVELGKELDAAVVEVQLRVHFVQLTNDNKGFLGRLAGTASVSSKVYPSITGATFTVQSSTRGTLTLKQPLALDASVFSEVRKAPTTTADVAGAIAVGLLQLAIGSKSSSSSEEMEAMADPARYREVMGSGLSTVNQMFVQRLRAGE